MIKNKYFRLIALSLAAFGIFSTAKFTDFKAFAASQNTGWYYDSGNWSYYNNQGIEYTGWLSYGGYWYYLDSNGAMTTGWKQIDLNWYYFYSSGAMAANTITPDGYYVGSNGVWQTGFVYDQNLTNQWRAKYNKNQYNGLAFNRFETVLNAYAKGLTDKYEIRGMEADGKLIGAKDPSGAIYDANNNPYDMGHKEWYEKGISSYSDWLNMLSQFIQCNKVIVTGSSLDEVYKNAVAAGLYNVDLPSVSKTAINYDEVVIYKDYSTGKYTVARLLLQVGPTNKLPDFAIQPGYSFP